MWTCFLFSRCFRRKQSKWRAVPGSPLGGLVPVAESTPQPAGWRSSPPHPIQPDRGLSGTSLDGCPSFLMVSTTFSSAYHRLFVVAQKQSETRNVSDLHSSLLLSHRTCYRWLGIPLKEQPITTLKTSPTSACFLHFPSKWTRLCVCFWFRLQYVHLLCAHDAASFPNLCSL